MMHQHPVAEPVLGLLLNRELKPAVRQLLLPLILKGGFALFLQFPRGPP